MTLRGLGVAGLLTGSVLALSAYLIAWMTGATMLAAWLMVAAIAVVMPASMLLGGRRRGPQPWLAGSALFLMMLLALVLGAALILPGELAGGPLLLGLPRRLALVVYLLGLVPFAILPIAFALDFRNDDLDEASLARLRDECAATRQVRE